MGSPPGPVPRGRRATSDLQVWHASPHVAYVTPSRIAARTASSNSPSARDCNLDVDTCHGGRGRGRAGV